MAWIDIINEDKAEGDLKDQYAKLVEPWGGVDNILKIHSLNPASLDAHVQLYETDVWQVSYSPTRPGNDCRGCIHHQSMPLLNCPSWGGPPQTNKK